jgi:RimJ/RimL family protein N-acetyltransferase
MQHSSIRLIACTAPIFRSILEGDAKIAEDLNVNVIPNWSEFGPPAFEYGLRAVIEKPSDAKWWTYLPVHIESNTLIGSCGYKGPPKNGMVEIGYEVAASYRNQGYATEIVKLLIKMASEDGNVQKIIAHTLAHENASTRVLTKSTFKLSEEINDAEDGLLWKWELLI